MSKRIVLKKDNKIFIGIPTTVSKRLGKCAEQIRRYVRDNKGGGHFEENGYEVFTNDNVEELTGDTFSKQLKKCKKDGVVITKRGVYRHCTVLDKKCASSVCPRT